MCLRWQSRTHRNAHARTHTHTHSHARTHTPYARSGDTTRFGQEDSRCDSGVGRATAHGRETTPPEATPAADADKHTSRRRQVLGVDTSSRSQPRPRDARTLSAHTGEITCLASASACKTKRFATGLARHWHRWIRLHRSWRISQRCRLNSHGRFRLAHPKW